MLLEAIRMVATGAADNTIGINAMIAGLTLNGADTRPPGVTVYNAVDHQWVARKAVAEDNSGLVFPAVAVFLHSPATLNPEIETVYRDGDLPIGLAVVGQYADSAAGMRDALYINRAILRFLTLFEHNSRTATFRTMNGIILHALTQLLQPPVYEAWGTVMVSAATLATWRARETSP